MRRSPPDAGRPGRAPAAEVAILVPAFNAAASVAEAIESALSQADGGCRVEVVVVDDGSSDATRAVAERFAERIRVEAGPHRGAPAARNRGLALSSAPFVQFLDADDVLRPGKVAGQLAAFRAHPEADVVYGPATIEWHGPAGVRTALAPIPPPHDPYALLALWHLPQTGAPLFRRAALAAVGGFCETQPCCQEHDLYLRLLIAGMRFHYHAANGAVYRRFAGGTLSTRDPALVRRERAKIEARLEAFLRERGELTAARQWAIDQARFEMARAAWPADRTEALALHRAIASRPFRPAGPAAPLPYRLAYRLAGFVAAERLAEARRGPPLRPAPGARTEPAPR